MAFWRKYHCKACGHKWDGLHYKREEPAYDCPKCAAQPQVTGAYKPQVFGMKTNRSRAMDMTQKILEEDYGMTDMKDNLREGDIAAKVDNQVAKAAQNMGGIFQGGAAPGGIPVEQLMAGAKQYTAQSNKEGRNPMNMFHSAAKKGYVPDTLAIAKQKAIRHNPNGKRLRP